jgi:hypothetical protein
MITFIIISYIVKVHFSDSDDNLHFYNYIGIRGFDRKVVLIGMMTNIIFGFIDNFGLFFGMDNLDDYLNFDGNNEKDAEFDELQGGSITKDDYKNIYDNPSDLSSLKTAGWGNTFSDFLGAFIGNAIGDIFLTVAKVENTPIISEIVGIVIGCILGIFIPAAMKRDSQKWYLLWGVIPGIVDFFGFILTLFGYKYKSWWDKKNNKNETSSMV